MVDRSHLLLRITLDPAADSEAIVRQLNLAKEAPGNYRAVQDGYFFRHSLGGRTQYTPVGVGGPGKLIDLIETQQEQPVGDWHFPVDAWLADKGVDTSATPVRPIVFIFDTIPALLRTGGTSLQANNLMKELAAAHADGRFMWHFHDDLDTDGATIELMEINRDDATYVFDRFFPWHQKPDGEWVGIKGLKHADLDISDHGLFIAGIIHSLAPAVEIHLIEILNRNGLARMSSFAQGIRKANDILQSKSSGIPVVFNASLMFDPPVKVFTGALKELTDSIKRDLQYPDTSVIRKALTDLRITEKEFADMNEHFGMVALAKVLEQSLAFAASIPNQNEVPPNHVWVAAAGNEANIDNRPDAGYPAFAPFVIGVGALRKPQEGSPRYQFASYSNKADPNSTNGIWAFGGDYDINFETREIEDQATNPRGGLLGISLKTGTGLARWAGTSFAAAVVSGVIARVMSHGKDVVWHDTNNGFFTKFDYEGGEWYALDLFQP